MKKFVIDSIMAKIKSGLFMVVHSKVTKVIVVSIFCFCAGIFTTGITVFTLGKINSHKGVGGLETSGSMEYSQNMESIFLDEAILAKENQSEPEAAQPSIQNPLVTYQTYRIKSGDMIGFIAADFGVTSDTIISVNNIKATRRILPGQYLKIPSMTGIIYTVRKNGETPQSIAADYNVDAQKCAMVNSLAINASLTAGTSLFVPDAALDRITLSEINGDLFHKPLRARYWLSSPYGWRDSPFNTGKRSFHGGLDMAVAQGTPIYAALEGKVTATGYNATYGNYVIITHHSGYKTLYGHMSAITCKKGNYVYTTTMIGRVGSTGMSTGPHLHFTVFKNNKTVNPALLIK